MCRDSENGYEKCAEDCKQRRLRPFPQIMRRAQFCIRSSFLFFFFFFFAKSLLSESLTQAMAYEEETPLPVIDMLIRVPFFIF